jgi:thiol-disulfide isomerase/thioredoxin
MTRCVVQAVVATVVLALADLPCIGGEPSAKDQLAAIETAQAAVRERYAEALKAAGDDRRAIEAAADRFRAELQVNVEAALALAARRPEDPAAFDALRFVVRINRAGPGDGTARALRMLLERGDARRPNQGTYLGVAALTLFQYPDAEKLLRSVLADNPNRDDRAEACLWLAKHVDSVASHVRRFRADPSAMKGYDRYTAAAPIEKIVAERDPESLEKEYEELLERVVSEFGDVRNEYGPKRTLGREAAGMLFAVRRLLVGQVAPEIQGRDHLGRPLRLSEHRGKVVVVTFSGNWCGPCVAMYPQERALVERCKGRPFALLSVNTDKDAATLQSAIDAGEIAWPCWWDGGTDGPITTEWGVVAFPSIFVLDRLGVIRFKNLRDEALDRAVADLLDESDRAASANASAGRP